MILVSVTEARARELKKLGSSQRSALVFKQLRTMHVPRQQNDIVHLMFLEECVEPLLRIPLKRFINNVQGLPCNLDASPNQSVSDIQVLAFFENVVKPLPLQLAKSILGVAIVLVPVVQQN